MIRAFKSVTKYCNINNNNNISILKLYSTNAKPNLKSSIKNKKIKYRLQNLSDQNINNIIKRIDQQVVQKEIFKGKFN